MNILNKLVIKNLKLNKVRTIVTIIGVILSTALIVSVAGMFTSLQRTLKMEAIDSYGEYHVRYDNVLKDEIKYIKNNKEVEKYYLTSNLGYVDLNVSDNKYKPYMHIMAFDKSALENGGINLKDGRFPLNSDEIIISEHMIEDGKIDYKIGEYIEISVCERVLEDGYILDQNNPYYPNEELEEDEYQFLEEKFIKEYKIVGIMERPFFEYYSAPGYTSITLLDSYERANISVLYKNPSKYKEITKKINEMDVDYSKGKYEISANNDLLKWEGIGISDNTMAMIYGMMSVIIGIIVFTSVFVIRNSFIISITEKTRSYGMLSSVGTTKKQLKKNILFESFIIGVIGIILGVLLGIIVVKLLTMLVTYMMAYILDEKFIFYYKVPIEAIIGSVILSIITIYLSSLKGIRKASKITPIEAIRNTDDIKLNSKKLKVPKFIKKVFGVGGTIAYKNMKRNKKKYRTTIVSLTVSIFVFISLSSFINLGYRIANYQYTDKSYNLNVNISYNDENDLNEIEEIYKEIILKNNLKNFNYSKISNYKLSEEYVSKSYIDLLNKTTNAKEYYISVASLSEGEYIRYINDIGSEYGDVILYNKGNFNFYTDGNFKNYEVEKYLDIKENGILTLEELIFDGNKSSIEDKREIKITKITDKIPMGYEGEIGVGYIFVNENVIEELGNFNITSLIINSEKPNELQKEIEKMSIYEDNDIFIRNFELEQSKTETMLLLLSIFLYGFIIVIMLIGITNIFNTITTNMKLRSKEFATFKSIGMTKKEFNNMIKYENFIYGFKSLLYGIPLGLIGSKLLFNQANNGTVEFTYVIPYKSIIISIISVFIIVGIIMRYSLNKVNKQNIIETIRKENV